MLNHPGRFVETPGTAGYDHAECVLYREDPDRAFVNLNAYVAASRGDAAWPSACGADGADCLPPEQSAWEEIRQAAAAAHDGTPACTFTTFVAYEWSGAPGTQNLHRNVIFESDKVSSRPTSYFDESWPDGLWSRLRADCDAVPGCDVLAIPHNSNLSSGLMFEAKKRDGSPIDRAYAEQQAAMEPLVEIMQHHGIAVYVPAGQLQSGMARITLGDVERARKLAARNVALLADAVRQGYEIVCTEPSAALCLTQEYPSLLDDDDARLVAEHTTEGFEVIGAAEVELLGGKGAGQGFGGQT